MRSSRLAALALALLAALPACRRAHGSARRFTLSVIGTNDLHGHVEALPMFGGFVDNLRRTRRQDGGAVLLLDAGDMFQGTLPSNRTEGAVVVRAYAALGYAAVAIGNHDFDYGPVGPAETPAKPGDDPRGALRARAAEAPFPFLAANLVDDATGAPPAWKNVVPTAIREVAGVKVGLVGLITASARRSTLTADFAGLSVAPLAPALTAAAADLRRRGATVVIGVAHAGGDCHHFNAPDDLGSCEADQEIFQVARALPPGAVDALVAGHTHKGVAHRVNGIPIVEAFSDGRAFSRVDLSIDRGTGRVVGARIFPPEEIPPPDVLQLVGYEADVVHPDPAVAAAIAPALAATHAASEQRLGVDLGEPIPRATKTESPLGNLVADLMRAARPDADVALTTGAAVRADLPAGPLTYGRLFETLPFDNRFALVPLTAGELAGLVARNLSHGGGVVSLSGVQAAAACADGALQVALTRPDGRTLPASAHLTLAVSEYLATGGDKLFPTELAQRARVIDGPPIRDAVADQLRARRAVPPLHELYDPARPRLAYPGKRPVRCD
jgi:2',3'-cyclic-nucleotide 2'-phosphodiesterase (5'-nucleotidase family)